MLSAPGKALVQLTEREAGFGLEIDFASLWVDPYSSSWLMITLIVIIPRLLIYAKKKIFLTVSRSKSFFC